MGVIEKANLKLKPKKCTFLCDVVHYLGYTISKNGIAPDQEKISKIRIYPVPTDATKLKVSIVLQEVHSQLLQDCFSFAQKVSSLSGHQLVRKLLKDLLCSAPVLAYPIDGSTAWKIAQSHITTAQHHQKKTYDRHSKIESWSACFSSHA